MLLPILYAVLALGGLGVLFGLLLTFVDKKFAVKTDERVALVRDQLGGANCGACGFSGCDAFAEAVVRGDANPSGCTPGGAKAAKAIAAIMGVSAELSEPLVARVRCHGTSENVSYRYDYKGLHSCRAASAISGGPKRCEFGCLGLGDCLNACKFGAIEISDNISVIDENRCVGCGMCAKACPRSIIDLLPRHQTVMVACRNKAIGKIARLQCKTACVGCKRCEKNCPTQSIHVVNGVAEINYDTCTRCGACAAGCPMHCIENFYLEPSVIDERDGENED